jgi:hypothetical protein
MNYFKKNSVKQLIFLAAVVLIILYIVYYLFQSSSKIAAFSGNGNFQEFQALANCADVTFKANDTVMYVNVKYKDLTGVSALHIHVNNNGMPGPILGWLGTTEAWQRGVAQNTAGSNSPCCTKNNPKCNLVAPAGTPFLTKEMEGTEQDFVFYKQCGKSVCNAKLPWISQGTLLDSHGFNFQQLINGVLTNQAPGADMLENVPFTSVN